jgi:hypothetical protein
VKCWLREMQSYVRLEGGGYAVLEVVKLGVMVGMGEEVGKHENGMVFLFREFR